MYVDFACGLFRRQNTYEINPSGGGNMSRVCSICGKGQTSGNNVSHSNRKTRRTFAANVQKVSFVKDGKVASGYVCARCLKSDKVERV